MEQDRTLTVGAAPFINGCSNLQLQVGAAPSIKGATLQLEPNIYTGENDALYSIYAIHAGQNPQFMRTWLKLYADMYK